MICRQCNGKGFIYVPDGEDDVDKDECPTCGGTGEEDEGIYFSVAKEVLRGVKGDMELLEKEILKRAVDKGHGINCIRRLKEVLHADECGHDRQVNEGYDDADRSDRQRESRDDGPYRGDWRDR